MAGWGKLRIVEVRPGSIGLVGRGWVSHGQVRCGKAVKARCGQLRLGRVRQTR